MCLPSCELSSPGPHGKGSVSHLVGAMDGSAADSLVLPTPVCPSGGQLVGPSPCSVAQLAPSGLLGTDAVPLLHFCSFTTDQGLGDLISGGMKFIFPLIFRTLRNALPGGTEGTLL